MARLREPLLIDIEPWSPIDDRNLWKVVYPGLSDKEAERLDMLETQEQNETPLGEADINELALLRGKMSGIRGSQASEVFQPTADTVPFSFTLSTRLFISGALMFFLGLALFLVKRKFTGQPFIPSILKLECAFGLFCIFSRTLPKLHEYPPMKEIESNHDKELTRQVFYVIFITMGTFLVWIIVVFVQYVKKPRNIDSPLLLEKPRAYLRNWVHAMELLDWGVVIIIACNRGVHYTNGLYWEDWCTIYEIIWVQSIAECIFIGAVSNANFWISAFPPTSSRVIRFKDKIQVALLIRLMQQELGPSRYIFAVLAGWSLLTTLWTFYFFRSRESWDELAETLSAQFFVAFVRTPTQTFQSESDMSWKEWICFKIEPLSQDGPFVFAMMHDCPQALVTCCMWFTVQRGSVFIVVSLFLSLAKSAVLWVSRHKIHEYQHRWAPAYQLRVERWQVISRLVGWSKCCKSKCFIRLRVWLNNKAAHKLQLLGKHMEVVNLQKETLLIGEVLDPTSPLILQTKHLLATSLSNGKELWPAMKLLTEVISQGHKVHGLPDKYTIRAKSHLATVLNKLGREKDALRLMRQVLHEREQVFGFNHTETLKTRSGLAMLSFKLGSVKEASHMLNEVLNEQTRKLGKQHPNTLFTRKNLADALEGLGRLQDAEEHLRDVCKIQEQVLGPDHGNTLNSRTSLAKLLSQRGQTHKQESLGIFRAVLQMQEEPSNFNLFKGLGTKEVMAESLNRFGCAREAADLHEEVFNARAHAKHLGVDHIDTLRAEASWASSLGFLGQQQDAQNKLEDVLSKQAKKLGPKHPDTLDTKSKLSSILRKLGEEPRARELMTEVLEERKRVLGETHPKTLKSKSGLADLYRARGGAEVAEKMLRDVLKAQTEQLGERHPNTLYTHSNLAIALSSNELKKPEAANMLRGVLLMQEEVLGVSHGNTVSTMQHLAGILIKLNQEQEALDLKKQLVQVAQSFRSDGLRGKAANVERKIQEIFESERDVMPQDEILHLKEEIHKWQALCHQHQELVKFERDARPKDEILHVTEELHKLQVQYQQKEEQCQQYRERLEALESGQGSPPSNDVRDFLERAGLSRFFDTFIQHGFDEMRLIRRIGDVEMNDIGLKGGHKMKMREALDAELAATVVEQVPAPQPMQMGHGTNRKRVISL